MSGGRTRLRRTRKERGWSQNDVAAKLYALGIELGVAEADLGVDARQVSRWENARAQPGPLYTSLMSRLFGLPPDQLDLPPVVLPVGHDTLVGGPTASSDEFAAGFRATSLPGDSPERHPFVGPLASLCPSASCPMSIEPWERLARILSRRSAPGEHLIRDLEARTAALHQMETTVPARQLFRHLVHHLEALTEVLTGPVAPALRHRLVVASGETAVLGGWMAWDLGDQVSAQGLYRLAMTAAHEADDPAIAACALAYRSYAAGARGNARQAQEMLEGARSRIVRSAFPASYAWVAAREAEELAKSAPVQALRLMEQSLASYKASSPETERPWTTFLDEKRMASFALTVNLKCGRLDVARQIAEQVLQSPGSPKTHALHALELAGTYLQTGSIDEGLELTERALRGVLETEMTWGVPKLKELSALLTAMYGSDQRAQRVSQWLEAVVQAPDLDHRTA